MDDDDFGEWLTSHDVPKAVMNSGINLASETVGNAGHAPIVSTSALRNLLPDLALTLTSGNSDNIGVRRSSVRDKTCPSNDSPAHCGSRLPTSAPALGDDDDEFGDFSGAVAPYDPLCGGAASATVAPPVQATATAPQGIADRPGGPATLCRTAAVSSSAPTARGDDSDDFGDFAVSHLADPLPTSFLNAHALTLTADAPPPVEAPATRPAVPVDTATALPIESLAVVATHPLESGAADSPHAPHAPHGSHYAACSTTLALHMGELHAGAICLTDDDVADMYAPGGSRSGVDLLLDEDIDLVDPSIYLVHTAVARGEGGTGGDDHVAHGDSSFARLTPAATSWPHPGAAQRAAPAPISRTDAKAGGGTLRDGTQDRGPAHPAAHPATVSAPAGDVTPPPGATVSHVSPPWAMAVCDATATAAVEDGDVEDAFGDFAAPMPPAMARNAGTMASTAPVAAALAAGALCIAPAPTVSAAPVTASHAPMNASGSEATTAAVPPTVACASYAPTASAAAPPSVPRYDVVGARGAPLGDTDPLESEDDFGDLCSAAAPMAGITALIPPTPLPTPTVHSPPPADAQLVAPLDETVVFPPLTVVCAPQAAKAAAAAAATATPHDDNDDEFGTMVDAPQRPQGDVSCAPRALAAPVAIRSDSGAPGDPPQQRVSDEWAGLLAAAISPPPAVPPPAAAPAAGPLSARTRRTAQVGTGGASTANMGASSGVLPMSPVPSPLQPQCQPPCQPPTEPPALPPTGAACESDDWAFDSPLDSFPQDSPMAHAAPPVPSPPRAGGSGARAQHAAVGVNAAGTLPTSSTVGGGVICTPTGIASHHQRRRVEVGKFVDDDDDDGGGSGSGGSGGARNVHDGTPLPQNATVSAQGAAALKASVVAATSASGGDDGFGAFTQAAPVAVAAPPTPPAKQLVAAAQQPSAGDSAAPPLSLPVQALAIAVTAVAEWEQYADADVMAPLDVAGLVAIVRTAVGP